MSKNVITIGFAALLLIACTGMAGAHFTMVFPSDSEATVWDVTPEDYIATLGETKTVYVMWGHPYEHILFNMASVPEVSVMKPDGTVLKLDATEITVDGMNEEG
ncbi:MAG: nickel transporter, partial [Euryarchaeota archaeon]|nr:nickel transporter [Euryarchaeota archaeon]